MDKRSLLAQIHETHAALEAAVRALDDAALEAPASGMDGWSRKDVVAHVAWWSDHSALVIEALRAGHEPYAREEQPGIDELNARILDDHRDDTPDVVRRSEVDAFSRLVAAVEAASDEDLFTVARFAWMGRDEPLAEMVEWDSTRHYRDHLAQLRA